MEKEFVPYELALALKQLGFDEPCIKGYTEEYKKLISFANTHTNSSVKNTLPTKPFTAPLYQQAFRWFRQKSNLRVQYGVFPHLTIMINYLIEGGREEEAELECLKKLIEIIKKGTEW